MKDKQIINGVDVSGCEYYNKINKHTGQYCICELEPNCLYKLYKRKEKECNELNKQLTSFMSGDYCVNGCSLKQQLDQIKTENEILEKVNKNNQEKIKKLNETLEEEFIAKQYGDETLFFTLMDIKEIAEKHAPRCAVPCPNDDYKCEICMLDDLKQILEKIKEVIKDEE